jgi:hypothetical protein
MTVAKFRNNVFPAKDLMGLRSDCTNAAIQASPVKICLRKNLKLIKGWHGTAGTSGKSI